MASTFNERMLERARGYTSPAQQAPENGFLEALAASRTKRQGGSGTDNLRFPSARQPIAQQLQQALAQQIQQAPAQPIAQQAPVTNPERRSAIKDALKVFSDAGGWSQDEQTPEAQAKIQAAKAKLFSFNTQPIAQQAPVAPSNVGGKISPVYKKFQAQLNQGGEVNKIQLLLNRFR